MAQDFRSFWSELQKRTLFLEFPFHLRNFFTRTSCSIWSLHQNSRSFGTILWWTFLLKVLSIYHKWLRTRARTYASITYKHFRVIYHSGFYLTQLLLVGCMLSLFSVVLFGIDGALVSFESLQLVCKVSVTLQASHVVTWTPILFLYCFRASLSFLRVLSDPWSGTIPVNTVGRAYCVSSTRSSSLRRQHKCQKQIGLF